MLKTKHAALVLWLLALALSPEAVAEREQQTQKPQNKNQAICFVTEFKATMGDEPAKVKETAQGLSFSTDFFRINATLQVSTPVGESYTVGVIQQCDAIHLRVDYGKAFTSWEMPYAPMNDISASGKT